MKVLAITQARTGSTRLPGKVLKKAGEKTLLEIHLERILKAKRINHLIVATTVDESDLAIAAIAAKMNVEVFRGSVSDVLDRFYQASKPFQPEYVVRITSDCPLIDPEVIDHVIELCDDSGVDYCSNGLSPTFPDGMDVEVFRYEALCKAWQEASTLSDREHVTPYIYRNSTFFGKSMFRALNYESGMDYSKVRLTVDEWQDLEVITRLIKILGTEAGWKVYADSYLSDININTINAHINRNEGYKK